VEDQCKVLRQVMLETGTTQSELSRLSGVHQPSISQFLSGKIRVSDDQLERLLSCMGYRLEVTRRPVIPRLTRSERHSWWLHRELSSHLTQPALDGWSPTIRRNLKRLRQTVQGQPHLRNINLWQSFVESRDLPALHRVLTGLDRDSIEMREVSPLGGLLSSAERAEALGQAV
jgi:transcriptional regulator with XRE-family HTH domain